MATWIPSTDEARIIETEDLGSFTRYTFADDTEADVAGSACDDNIEDGYVELRMRQLGFSQRLPLETVLNEDYTMVGESVRPYFMAIVLAEMEGEIGPDPAQTLLGQRLRLPMEAKVSEVVTTEVTVVKEVHLTATQMDAFLAAPIAVDHPDWFGGLYPRFSNGNLENDPYHGTEGNRAVALTDGSRTAIVDPSGYDYARYLHVAMEVI